MAYKYTKKYQIFKRSEDGLLKSPKRMYGYGEYDHDFDTYASEELAIEAITKHDYGDCLLLPVVCSVWVDDDE